jgi:excisionase family DNA binding protein
MAGAKDVYISVSEAAKILKISRQRVLQLIKEGRLTATKVANAYLIQRADLAAVENRKPGRPRKKGVNKKPRSSRSATRKFSSSTKKRYA